MVGTSCWEKLKVTTTLHRRPSSLSLERRPTQSSSLSGIALPERQGLSIFCSSTSLGAFLMPLFASMNSILFALKPLSGIAPVAVPLTRRDKSFAGLLKCLYRVYQGWNHCPDPEEGCSIVRTNTPCLVNIIVYG